MPPCPPSLGLGLGLQYYRAGGPSLDPDAAAYIDALVSGGATVTSVQSDAIDTFIRAEKAGERWDLIKRLYLPIWELAAPNAICMRSLTSGTFVGGVTHGAGFVQGDGSTGYFDFDGSPGQAGLTLLDAGAFLLVTGETDLIDRQLSFGTRTGNTSSWVSIGSGPSTVTATIAVRVNSAGSAGPTVTDKRCLYSTSRVDADTIRASVRRGASRTTGLVSTGVGVLNSTVPMRAMMMSLNGPPAFSSDEEALFGAYGLTLTLTDTEDAAFTLNLKKLWEDCTPLTLPA